jgi:hypothetical protein
MRVHMTFVTTVGLPLDNVTPPQSNAYNTARVDDSTAPCFYVQDLHATERCRAAAAGRNTWCHMRPTAPHVAGFRTQLAVPCCAATPGISSCLGPSQGSPSRIKGAVSVSCASSLHWLRGAHARVVDHDQHNSTVEMMMTMIMMMTRHATHWIEPCWEAATACYP